jgi:hypothetical protein
MEKLRILIPLLIIFCLTFSINTQDDKSDTALTANSQITELRLSGFEDASFWQVSMPRDQGIIVRQSRPGGASDVKDENALNSIKKRDEEYGIPQGYPKEKVLGVKVIYISRGHNWFAIRPAKPLVVEGKCTHLSVFIAGRNYKHVLKIFILDYFGREQVIYVDKLNFVGWKELVAPIPERIVQSDYHYAIKQGIKFNGFLIECAPLETYGIYYMYFDELRAKTDIFNEKTEDNAFDISDDW